MIRKTLGATQRATYSIDLPHAGVKGFPFPAGTGFFVSADGWFITAAHVVTTDGTSAGPARADIGDAWLMKETRFGGFMTGMCQYVELDEIIPELDIAILKADFARNANKEHLKGLSGFPSLGVSRRQLEEGEPVYAFGYPLSEPQVLVNTDSMTMMHGGHAPRTTSAIIAATMDRSKPVMTNLDPLVYVLDKALNYGNSGGPIVAVETGHVHALCSGFQPVEIRQPGILLADGNEMRVVIPSLYGVVASLSDPRILGQLEKRGVKLLDS